MKIYNRFSKIIALLLAAITVSSMNTYGYTLLEEDDIENDIVVIEESSNIFDMNNTTTDKLKVSARCAIALDSKTKQILYEQNADEIVPMASTTKILTALVAIKFGDLDREVTISKNAASIRGSKVGYMAGEKVKMKELLFGLMFKSGNDAAIAIAEDIGGNIENFSNIMNDYAKSLGLVSSHFESPHGLDSAKHYTCAYDLALLTSTAMENELFREICGSKLIEKDTYNFTREYSNINKILWKIPEANGVKTGYTGQAGKCLVTSVNHEGRDIIIVVLNCHDRWNVTDSIFKYVSDSYCFKTENTQELIKSTEFIKLGSVINECEFDYGFKDKGELELEVFSPVIDKEEGEIIGKVSLNDSGNEIIKKALICKKKLTIKEFEKDIVNNEESTNKN